MMRRLLAAALLAVATSLAAEPLVLRATPVPLAYENPPAALGPLVVPGAVELSAPEDLFGGWSGLHLDAGLRLTAISDLGRWMTARLVLDEAGRLAGVTGAEWGRLSDGAGRPLPRGRLADAESLARQPDGTWLIGFERWHRIRAYRDLAGPGTWVAPPPGLEVLPANGGLEALTVLPDGRVLAIAEEPDIDAGGRARRAWIRTGTRWTEGSYGVPAPYVPVDAAALPDGSVLVLERRFSIFGGFGTRIARIAGPLSGASGFRLAAEEVARIERPLITENFEGIAAARGPDGELLVAVIADDNLNPLQRSRLLLFRLDLPM